MQKFIIPMFSECDCVVDLLVVVCWFLGAGAARLHFAYRLFVVAQSRLINQKVEVCYELVSPIRCRVGRSGADNTAKLSVHESDAMCHRMPLAINPVSIRSLQISSTALSR